MKDRKQVAWLASIIILALIALWIDVFPPEQGINILGFQRDLKVHKGLDLEGGISVLLQAEADHPLSREDMRTLKAIVEKRVNGLGVSEPLIQLQGGDRIVVELPGIKNQQMALKTIGQTGLLEFIDAGTTYIPPGTPVKTTARMTTTAPITVTQNITGTGPFDKVFTTIVTGKELKDASTSLDEYGKPQINFSFKPEGAKKIAEYTSSHVNQYMAIVLDGKVISCPVIKSPIPDGSGRITGKFTLDEAKSIAVQLKYGSLPVPLKIVEIRSVGPTLGQDSIHRSILAGIIGLVGVLLFMLFYYRLPGFLADLALVIYALLNLAIYKLIPVTLTLPGIAAFILTIGMAVDANILIFERLKEELRQGRPLFTAIDLGFKRAWPSIRDANASTLITSAILFWFGSHFGASMVKGFALTLAIGVLVSLFTAVMVTRAFLDTIMDMDITKNRWWFGV
jgi:preprotein translocase subunit SecD